MTNREVIEKTKEEMKLRGLSEFTESEYLGKLSAFMEYYENREVREMSEVEIRAFLSHLIEKGAASGTVNIYNSALRFVFGAVLKRTLNYQMIPRRRMHRELPDIMSKADIVRFLEGTDNLRDKAIFATIYGSGMRLGEISRLRIQDIDSENMRIFVHHGKGGKDHYTLLSESNLEILRDYWRAYCKPPFKSANCVVEYLGRYTHRVALSNSRIISIVNGIVTFKWRDYRDNNKWKIMSVSASEFIRRFLMHILPQRFTKIRHFGFLASRVKSVLVALCQKLTNSLRSFTLTSNSQFISKMLGFDISLCRVCGFLKHPNAP